MCLQTDKHTDTHTDTVITILRRPNGGEVTIQVHETATLAPPGDPHPSAHEQYESSQPREQWRCTKRGAGVAVMADDA